MKSSLNLKMILLIGALFFLGAWVVEAAVDPVVVEVHYQNGVKFYKRGLPEKAVRSFEKTLSLDPDHQEAKQFLARIKLDAERVSSVSIDAGKREEISALQKEAEELYRKRDYAEAIVILNKIIALNPVNPDASLFKERSEAAISRQVIREKKKEDRQVLSERALEEKNRKKEQAKTDKAERREMLKKRKEIDGERRLAQKERTSDAREELVSDVKKQRAREEKERKAEERREAAAKRREERLREKEEKREVQKQERLEKAGRCASKAGDEKEEAAEEVGQSQSIKESESQRVQEEKGEVKKLFLEGVDSYGRKNFQAAIASFSAVVEAEKSSKKVYTRSAERMIDKSKKRMEQVKGEVSGSEASGSEVSGGS